MIKSFCPYGGAREMWRSQDRLILYDGPAGTGKTRLLCQKSHCLCALFPGLRVMWLRETRASLNESVLETFEKQVCPNPRLFTNWNLSRGTRTSYNYKNGSKIVLGGGDYETKVMSSEYDVINVFEATEIMQELWDNLDSRLRHGKLGWHQMVADCNPSYPNHWLKLLADSGKIKRIPAHFTDNPSITEEYKNALSNLHGFKRARLFEGVWCAAEGVVFDLESCIIPHVEPPAGEHYGGWDFGFSAPAAGVAAVVYKDKHGRDVIYVYEDREKNNTPIEVHAAWMRKHTDTTWFCDPSAPESIRKLNMLQATAVPAINRVLFGIDAVNSVIEGGTIFISENCKFLRERCSAYVYGPDGVKPEKVNDHLPDSLRYLVASLAGRGQVEMNCEAEVEATA